MYLKRYAVTSDLEELKIHPVCRTVSRQVNARVIDTYRVALDDGEHIRYECVGAPLDDGKRLTVELGGKTVDIIRTARRLTCTLSIILYIALALLINTFKNAALALYGLVVILILSAVIILPFAILLYVSIIKALKKKVPAIAEATQVYYLITDKRLISRHKDDVQITDLRDILCVVPREVDITCGNVKIGLVSANHESCGMFNIEDWETAGVALQNAVDDAQHSQVKQERMEMTEEELVDSGEEMEIPDLDTSVLYNDGWKK